MRSRSSLILGFQPTPDRRARPTCKLSLATASASTTTTTKSADIASTPDVEEVDFMQVDGDTLSPATVTTTESSPSWSVVPFPTSETPTRKLALLRSCPSVAEDLSSSQDLHSSADPSPPRKRTRTSAILAPSTSSTKFHRPNRSSLTLTRSTLPSRLPRLTTSSLFSGHPTQPPTTTEPFTYTFMPSPTPSQTNATTVPYSRLLHLISELVTSVATGSPSTAVFRRKKSFSGGPHILYNVYKSLLHGLASRYLMIDTSQCLQDSQLDVQDALLAERLRWHLTLQGHDVSAVPFDLEKIDKAESGEPLAVESDNTFPADVTSPPHSEVSSTLPALEIMPYDQLVSSLFLQKRLEGRRKSLRKGAVQNNRPQSKLAIDSTPLLVD